MLLYVIGAFALLVLGGIGYFFTKGGNMEVLQEKLKGITDSINPKK
jgi:hypothetical protein